MPCQSLFVPLTLIIPLCIATLLRNLYLYQLCLHFISSRILIGIGPRVYGHLAKIEFTGKITQGIWKGNARTFELVSVVPIAITGSYRILGERTINCVFKKVVYLYRVEQISKQHTKLESTLM